MTCYVSSGTLNSTNSTQLDIHKTRINGLSCGEESMTIYSAVLIQYQRVTDGRTDGQPISITCFSIADTRKNRCKAIITFCDHCDVCESQNAIDFLSAMVTSYSHTISEVKRFM